jgi:hypothetical protein
MAADSNTTNADLAFRLIDHADAIDNVACHQLEADIRAAAERLWLADTETPPAVVQLITELRKAAAETHDGTTAEALKAML